MGPLRDERGLPRRCFSHEETFDASASVSFTCGSGKSTLLDRSSCLDRSSVHQMTLSQENKSSRCTKYNSSQWMTLIGLAFGNFAIGACVSLQAPFFPREAERKGASATEYGVVFGVYQLTFLVGSFFFGKMVAHVCPAFMLTTGIFIVGSSSILFGILDRAPSSSFIPLAVAVRIAEGIGSIAAKTSTHSIIGAQFPETVATTFASLETCLGVGLIVGPTMGGALYELGGYPTPFMVTGVLLLLDAVVILCVLPKNYESLKKSGEMIRFWSHPSVLLNSVVVFSTFVYLGFQGVALEPHIRQFGLSPLIVGLIFVVCGGTYAVTAPAWGALIDKGVSTDFLKVMGCFVLLISQGMLGPASIFPQSSHLWMVILALFLCGVGVGAKLVSTFISCLRKTISRGFPNDLSTFGLVSTMYSSSLSLGAFTGPTLGGYLLDVWGFSVCCSALMAVDTFMMVVLVLSVVFARRKDEEESLLEKPKGTSEFEGSFTRIY